MGATSTATTGRTRLENQLMDVMALHHEAVGSLGVLIDGVMECIAADMADDPARSETRKMLAEVLESVRETAAGFHVELALQLLDRSNGMDWRDTTLPAVRSGIQGLILQLERNGAELRLGMGRLHSGVTPEEVRRVALEAVQVVRLSIAMISGWQRLVDAAIDADLADDIPLRACGDEIYKAICATANMPPYWQMLSVAQSAWLRARGLDFGDATKERLLRSVNPLLERLGRWIGAVEGTWGT